MGLLKLWLVLCVSLLKRFRLGVLQFILVGLCCTEVRKHILLTGGRREVTGLFNVYYVLCGQYLVYYRD